MKNLTMTVSSDLAIGQILLLGRFGGAYCNHYRIERIEDGVAHLVPIVAQSVHNDDGTFSTVWGAA